MGTRADFYVANGGDADTGPADLEWIGSVAYDGFPEDFDADIPYAMRATDPEVFRRVVQDRISFRDDGTSPDLGWPWPWETSVLTDYSYCFWNGSVYVASGYPSKEWVGLSEYLEAVKAAVDLEEHEWEQTWPATFPNMKDSQNVTLGPRSGAMFVGG